MFSTAGLCVSRTHQVSKGLADAAECRPALRTLLERAMGVTMRTVGAAIIAAFLLGAVAGQNIVDLGACNPIGPRVACGKRL